MRRNHAATRSGDRTRTADVASEFDAIITALLAPRRAGADAPDDPTTALMRDRIDGRPLTDDEIVSILRNWTGGDLGSIALCVGVISRVSGAHPDVQDRLRASVSAAELDAALDEMLRIDDPFVSNRRRTTCPVRVGGASIPEGEIVKLHWTSANRDEGVFGDPDAPARSRSGRRVDACAGGGDLTASGCAKVGRLRRRSPRRRSGWSRR